LKVQALEAMVAMSLHKMKDEGVVWHNSVLAVEGAGVGGDGGDVTA